MVRKVCLSAWLVRVGGMRGSERVVVDDGADEVVAAATAPESMV